MGAGKSFPLNPKLGDRQGTRVLTIKVAERAGEALDWLAHRSILGVDAEAVATFLLINELDRRMNSPHPSSKAGETR